MIKETYKLKEYPERNTGIFGKKLIVNKAFNSLLFRGHRKMEAVSNPIRRHNTYGGIISCRVNDVRKFAVVQGRYTRKWSFPKGHAQKNEDALVCAIREVTEETGIDNLPEPKNFLQVGYGSYFIFELPEERPLVQRDHNEIISTRWVTLDEMEGMDFNSDGKAFRLMYIEDAE
jgi:8-oxo-dGTP pyrophosphatase MutT (NUDIX family)